ncbi:hypothetical protein [uncultured Sphingorhabdus sp.]|uniref:hypothetical protein n=1 Tax=uncultured Sphingorhabdus sp. TaxID=1686106 RepID=UPI00262215A8|nr:hypothetical protein [uncultured Sphingorhabdus sp.]
MKIGLIGNMNNNNFALMRYFRDLGVDAHLLLYKNDGQGTLSHFKPEADTWDIEKWAPYIHQTEIPNAPVAAFDFPLSWILALRSRLMAWLGKSEAWVKPISKREIAATYGGYDKIIASGISPAVLGRAGFSLDIFYPYSTGVEFFRAGTFVVRDKGFFGVNKIIINKISRLQESGICASKNVINYEMGLTHDVLTSIGVQPHKLAIPMVYNKEKLPKNPPSKPLENAWAVIANSKFTILQHSRLLWRNPGHYSNKAWIKENKNNDWLLYAFADFCANRSHLKPVLLIVEYGPDITATKQLVKELGIDANVHWLPKMFRKELMWLLSRVSIGVGEFYDLPRIIWGGTGWEAFASGKPLLQGFNFDAGEFEQLYGYPAPAMLPVRRREDILHHLLEMADDGEKRQQIGQSAKQWFDQYNGISLAKQWLSLL